VTKEKNNIDKKFNFENSDLYQRSLAFSNEIYNITKDFPNSELYGLTDQLKRASMSISSNLAEGYNNHYKKEKMRYYRIARGSVHECVPQLTVSFMQNFIDTDKFNELHDESYELSSMISGLIRSIKKRNK
jgi:four helix bundle protein